MKLIWQRAILTACLLCIALSMQQKGSASSAAYLSNDNSPMGTNLTAVTDWSTELVFIDLFKTSRPWIPLADSGWDTFEGVHTDSDGWVTEIPSPNDPNYEYDSVATLMATQHGPSFPTGEFLVLYDGEGTIDYDFDAVFLPEKSQPNRHVIHVDPDRHSSGILLKITETNPDNYIRNIRVLLPGYDEFNSADIIFNPDFLESIAPYKVLRFMDWSRTNYDVTGEPIRSAQRQYIASYHPAEDGVVDPILRPNLDTTALEWHHRPLTDNSTYATDRGVPNAVAMQLANLTRSDAWINIPHLATEEYMRAMARETLALLDSDRYLYVEFSNEIWNADFGQQAWAMSQAQELWPNENIYSARSSFYGMKSAEMCNIFEEEWGDEADRVICILASQATSSWITNNILNCPLWDQAPCANHNVDMLAIAPYFGQHIGHPDNEYKVNEWLSEPDGGLNSLFRELEFGDLLLDIPYYSKATLADAIENVAIHKTLADNHALSLIAYEGGQHLVGGGPAADNEGITDLFGRANRDVRMGQFYDRYLTGWNEAGGEMFVHFNSTSVHNKWGNWGSQRFFGDLEAPKKSAIETYIENTTCDWATCNPPIRAVATLQLPWQSPSPLGERSTTVLLDIEHSKANFLRFAIGYDPRQIILDTADDDFDGVLNAIRPNLPAGYQFDMTVEAVGVHQVLVFEVEKVDGSAESLNSGPLFQIDVTVLDGGPGIYFYTESAERAVSSELTVECLDQNNQPLPCITEGSSFTATFTAVNGLISSTKNDSILMSLLMAIAVLTVSTKISVRQSSSRPD